MKAVAFNGSARKGGNTAVLLNIVLDRLSAEGVETELIELAGQNLSGCTACYQCFENKDCVCVLKNDPINGYIAKMQAADVILLGSPTYFADLSANMKALIERCGMVSKANNNFYRRKLGAAVVAVRRAGAYQVFNSLNSLFLIGEMIVVGSSYWNIGIGKDPGHVKEDQEGIQTMEKLGENIAWLLNKM